MNPSLRLRLLAGTLAIVTLIWLALSIFAWRESRHEAEEIFDAHLAQTAMLLAAFVGDEADELDEHLPAHRYARKVAFQVWHGSKLLVHSLNAPDTRLSAVDEGFSDSLIDGRDWRVYSVWDKERRHLIQVAEARRARDAVSRELAVHLTVPLAVALPLLALSLILLIRHNFAPLATLAASIGERSPQRLDPIPLAGAPRELAPILTQLNTLLGRVAGSLEQERRFTADAAHELRTPLAAMRTHAQVAQASSDAAERTLALERVVAAADRATHLVTQLLTLARVDAGALDANQPLDLRALSIDVIADAVPAALAKQIELELTDGPSVPMAGNSPLLSALLRNLIDNAVRYGPPHSRVRIACRMDDGHPCLEVSDEGPGIPTEERERVLERFYRIVGSGETGSGLGLSIVARVAELHGASFTLADGPNGKGLCARVVFSMPINS
jgi:two-component system sensor histidine kinase QseC